MIWGGVETSSWDEIFTATVSMLREELSYEQKPVPEKLIQRKLTECSATECWLGLRESGL